MTDARAGCRCGPARGGVTLAAMLSVRAWPSLLLPLWLSAVVAAQAAAPAAPAADPASALRGRVETHGGLTVLRTWGTPDERGYAHGRLLADRIAATALPEFSARFGRKPGLLQQARAMLPRLIELPDDVKAELAALWRGVVDSKVALRLDDLDRDFDFVDLQIVTALDVFGLMGCSSFTVWGEQAVGGGVMTARNFDWPFTGAHMLDQTIVHVAHLENGRAVAAVTWPGYLGAVTGVSSDGVMASLHVGSAKVSWSPEPSSWPSAIAARAILAHGAGEAEATFAKAAELLGQTSPPVGFMTHVTLPAAPARGAPTRVFEADVKSAVPHAHAGGPLVLTNHFRTRADGRKASGDSVGRQKQLDAGIAGCIDAGDRKVDVAEAWTMLQSVERGGSNAFGTLHALVFRHEPWLFELRVGALQDGKVVAAPSSPRQHALTRAQLFAEGESLPR